MTTGSRSSAPHGPRLFGEPERQPAHIAYVDGASRGNPGAAAYAVVVKAPSGKTEFEIGKYFGRATNNVAEYYGLITALDAAQSRGIQRLVVRSDSELMVRQMQGRYKVKSADLKPLYERALKLSRGFASFAIEHVPREMNAEADALANRALDETSRSGSPRAASEPVNAPAAPASTRLEPSHSISPRPVDEPLVVSTASAAATRREPLRAASPTGASRGRAAAPDGATRIRARYSAGALHPLEALDLDEGDIVEVTIKKPSDR